MDPFTMANETMSMNRKLAKFVENYTFIEVGNIKSLSDDKTMAEVLLPYTKPDGTEVILRGVELLRMGNSKVGIHLMPSVGDCVLLLCPKSYLPQFENARTATQRPNFWDYGICNVKALLIQGAQQSNEAVSITVDADSKVAITLNQAEVTINGNTIKADDNGVLINNHFLVKKNGS